MATKEVPSKDELHGPTTETTTQVPVTLYRGIGPMMLHEQRMSGQHESGYKINWSTGIPAGFKLRVEDPDGNTVAVAVVNEAALVRTLTDQVLAELGLISAPTTAADEHAPEAAEEATPQ